MDRDEDGAGSDASAGGDPACWLDQVRDCCGTLESEPHRPGCGGDRSAGDRDDRTPPPSEPTA
ncbi:MAG TPA: hypothetical protein VGI86_01590 [Acidimicrobiia bacterium]|jgi:hypothetical protein